MNKYTKKPLIAQRLFRMAFGLRFEKKMFVLHRIHFVTGKKRHLSKYLTKADTAKTKSCMNDFQAAQAPTVEPLQHAQRVDMGRQKDTLDRFPAPQNFVFDRGKHCLSQKEDS